MHVPLWKWDLNYAEVAECAASCGMLTFTSCRQGWQEEAWGQLHKRARKIFFFKGTYDLQKSFYPAQQLSL